MKNIHKLLVLLTVSTLVGGCNPASDSSNNEKQTNSSANAISLASSKNDKASSNKPSQSSDNPSSSVSQPQSYSFSDQLESNPQTCANHVLEESIRIQPTIIQRGIKRRSCPNCGGFSESYIYDLDEFNYLDTTYAYDGKERELLIDGLLPYGVTVIYENNKLTEIGTKTATAKIYDPDGHLLTTKNAKITIIENAGLPNVRIGTETNEDPNYKEKTNYTILSSFSIDNCPDQYKIDKATGGIRVRGNSTNQASVTKRAWRLKFDNKINLLGLNGGAREKSWVLLADFFDSSMFRNASAFTMGNDLFNYNGNLYCTDRQHVNVYMNGDYRGVYLLAEQQQAKLTTRIPINEAAEDYTGTDIGYLLEIDGLIQQGNSDEEYTFTTGSGNSWGGWGGWGGQGNSENTVNGVNVTDKYYAVKTDCYSNDQLEFIKKYTTNVLKIMKQACKGEKLQVLDENNELIDSPYSSMYETLNSVIDVDSFFRMYVLQEFMKNYDVGWGSFYLYVDFSNTSRVKRLTLSAPWDFDLGEGNKTSGNGVKTNDDYLNGKYTGMTEFNPWLYLLSQTDFFNEMFDKYYSVFYNSGVYEGMINYINYEASAFKTDFDNTYTRWDLKNATNSGMSTRRGYNNHQEAVDYLLNWYKERKTYLDSKYLK